MARYTGSYARKIDGQLYITGRATYVDDITLPGMLHAAVARSPYPHARITRIDASEALRCPGVSGVLTGQEAKALAKPFPPYIGGMPGLRFADCYCLAVDRVRYVGEGVAAVAATTREEAHDAADLIQVDYEPLTLVDAENALKPDAPLLYDEWGDNVAFSFRIEGGDVERAFREADVAVEDQMRVHRHTGTPLETRGYVAQYNAVNRSLVLWSSTQVPHYLRTVLSEVLGLQESRVRVIQPSVGGAFGLKASPFPEEVMVCLLSMKTMKPVKWVETRRESFLANGHARQQVHTFEAAAKKDGTIIGLKDHIAADLGAFFSQRGIVQLFQTAKTLPGPYRIQNLLVEVKGFATNKVPYQPYRGFGRESSCLIYERALELVSKELGLDPAEVRMRNLVRPHEFPYRSPTGNVYDSGDYPSALKKALEIIDYRGFRDEQRRLRRKGVYRGLGIGFVVEPCGAAVPLTFDQGYEATTVRVDPSGTVTVLTGVSSPGSGNETSIAQVVADSLGVMLEDVTVIQGDTAVCPYGLGNFSSRSTIVGASSAAVAAKKLRDKILKAAAAMLEARETDLEIAEGVVSVKGAKGRGIALKEVATAIYTDIYRLGIQEPGLEATHYFLTPGVDHSPDREGKLRTHPAFSYAAHIATVEVEGETGAVKVLRYVVVHDCGVPINLGLVEGQNAGGIAQGIGGALYEELVYDRDGQLLTSSFMDYILPTAMEIPRIEIAHQVTPSPNTVIGSKGCGEGGAMGAMPALTNAVEDALSPMAVRIRETPFTSERMWRLLRGRVQT